MDAKEILQNENLEIELFLDAMYEKHGYDFRSYSRAHLKRRIMNIKNNKNYDSISMMTHDLIWDKDFKKNILHEFSINYTEMFRDPEFYNYLREEVFETLRTFPFIKIWHAGCSTGEEVYSLAIMLKEAGLYDRCQIYATDFNDSVLKIAESGIYPLHDIREYTKNYQTAGGKRSFSDYYDADNHNVILDQSLKEKIVFANHNLVSDGVFGEINLIMCRNVLIYFNKDLQDKVFKLFEESLCQGCFMCLGSKETLKFSKFDEKFDSVSEKHKVYKKKYCVK
jgi:chemotaxis protein methyltransferase CheR